MAFNKRKFTTYAKLTGIAFLVLLVLLFMASNREKVTIKFLVWEIWEAPLFALIFLMANLGIFVFLVCRKIRHVINDVRQLRREEQSREKLISEIKSQVREESNSHP